VPYLDIVTADQRHCLPLGPETVTIGRTSTNSVALDDQQASRAHCVIEKTIEGYRLRDLDSRNGTYHNGDQIESVLLNDGDEIQIGAARIVYHAGEPSN
jgi:pSer/pThr/pTyr-binding forkhead associated (FHA) protein